MGLPGLRPDEPGDGPLSGCNLRVATNIVPVSEHAREDVAAVVVEIVYRFSNVGGSQGTFVDRFVLFGEGRNEVRTTSETSHALGKISLPARRPIRSSVLARDDEVAGDSRAT